jgi:eukaryotic-like serine/threonine-protein kinase
VRLNPPAIGHPPPVFEGMDAILFQPETSMRRALILALGTFGARGLSPADREPLTSRLLQMYRDDPDAGIHGAAAWTLRQWGQKEKVSTIDAELGKLADGGGRRWYVNNQGQTFVVIDGPVDFQMGTPPTEPDRGPTEQLHRRVIPRRYAIATNEVTGKQFQRFLKENVTRPAERLDEPDGPQHDVNWYEAAQYCNWLSQQLGIPKEQWCYEPNPSGVYGDGMTIKADVLTLQGYRLPTEAEWEYGCRAGATSSRYYGDSDQLLDRYGWCLLNAKGRPWPCGKLLPNDLGLFDVLGNVHEWCQDLAKGNYRPGKEGNITDKIEVREHITENSDGSRIRIMRGGSYSSRPSFGRSGFRNGSQASSAGDGNYGFRPARTIP